MIIPLYKAERFKGQRIMVDFHLQLPHFTTFLTTNAIIDTGSPHTIIMSDSLKRSRIPFSKLKPLGPINLGGIPLNLVDLGDGILTFKDKENNLVKINHKMVGGLLAGYTPIPLPNIIGIDFISKNKIALKFDDEANPYWERD